MRLLRWWHRWLGFVLVPVFVLSCLSGALLVYQKPLIHSIVTPGAVLPQGYDIDQVAAELARLVRLPGFVDTALIKAPNPREPFWTLRHADGEKQLFRLGDLTPYKTHTWLLPALEFVRHLHIELLLGVVGETVLLITGLFILFLAVSGIWLWWPARRIFHWQWLLPPPSRWHLKWLLRFHSHSGILLVPLVLLVVTTSTVMMWQKVNNALKTPVTQPVQQAVPAYAPEALARAVHLTHRQVPGSWPTYIRLLAGERPQAKIRVRLAGEWHANGRTNVFVDLRQTAIVKLQHARAAAPLRKVLNQMYPLHSSYGMPLYYSLLVFATGLGGLWLAATGTISLVRRLRKAPRGA